MFPLGPTYRSWHGAAALPSGLCALAPWRSHLQAAGLTWRPWWSAERLIKQLLPPESPEAQRWAKRLLQLLSDPR